uniref:Uncharacterized protein n=1 Tax=Timema shepardi TaxID=629360 RepID=A0A7R9G6T9_TIMSH|nr:unnamed protein product [Timema shepardi]
MHCPSVSIWI